MSARRKNARRLRHGRQHPSRQRQLSFAQTPLGAPAPDPVRTAIDRAQAASARALTPALREKLDDSWRAFQEDIDRLKNRIATRRKQIDEDRDEKVSKIDVDYRNQLSKLGQNFDKERRLLERELDDRRERILRTHVDAE